MVGRSRSSALPTPCPRPAAFSITEILIAFFILGLALLPVIGLFDSSGRQARQTADYGLAVTLQEKAAEDLRLANWENVHLGDQIVAEPDLALERSVVDGQSPFFGAIEDARKPFGEIHAGVDPGVDQTFPLLYRQLKSFTLGFSTRSVALATGTALDLTLSMRWRDFQRKDQTLPMEVRLAGYGTWLPRPREVEDRSTADEMVRQLLYPDRAGATLQQVVASIDADLATVRHVGETAVLAMSVSGSTTSFLADIRGARSAVAAAPDRKTAVRAQLYLARLFERRAMVCLQVMCYLAVPLRVLARSFEVAKLGSPPPDKLRYAVPVSDVQEVITGFDWCLGSALTCYSQAYNSPLGDALPRRLRIRAFMKVLEVWKLGTLTSDADDTTGLLKILEEFERFHLGRNMNFARFARREQEICKDLTTLKAAYPPGRYQPVLDFKDNVVAAVQKVAGAP